MAAGTRRQQPGPARAIRGARCHAAALGQWRIAAIPRGGHHGEHLDVRGRSVGPDLRAGSRAEAYRLVSRARRLFFKRMPVVGYWSLYRRDRLLVCLDPDRDQPLWATRPAEDAEASFVAARQATGDGRWIATDLQGRVTLFDGVSGRSRQPWRFAYRGRFRPSLAGHLRRGDP